MKRIMAAWRRRRSSGLNEGCRGRYQRQRPVEPLEQRQMLNGAVNPELLSRWSGSSLAVAVQGDYACPGAGATLRVLNISNPAAPALLGSLSLPTTSSVFFGGDKVYLGTWDAGLQIVNVRNTAAPSLPGTFPLPGYANAVAVSGNLAIVGGDRVSGVSALRLLDVTVPTAPVLLGQTTVPGEARRIIISGSRACVASNDLGIHILDIANTASALLLGTYSQPGSYLDIAVAETTIYAAQNWSGPAVIDAANPQSPSLPGSSRDSRCRTGFFPAALRAVTLLCGLYFSRMCKLAVLVSIPLCFAGCAGSELRPDLDSRDPAARIMALKQIAADGRADYRTLEKVIDELCSSDAAVRFYAIHTLQSLTGQTMGYRWFAAAAQRDEPVKAWRRWLAERQPAGPATRAGG